MCSGYKKRGEISAALLYSVGTENFAPTFTVGRGISPYFAAQGTAFVPDFANIIAHIILRRHSFCVRRQG